MGEIYLYNHKPKKKSDFNIWLAFPGPEEFALSSLGYLWLYKTLDETNDFNIETIYQDTKKTLISRQNINMIGFSFSFDMDIFNIFSIMQQQNIPFKACERDDSYPIIFCGGPVTTANPEPYKEFFDFFVIGDGEELNYKAVQICKENKHINKDAILKKLSEIDGIYVPKFPHKEINKITTKLTECVYTPIISDKAFFKNTFIIEAQRGCANRCGFCIASYINLPVRFVKYDKIIELIDLGLKHTQKIALLGAQITAHPRFSDICSYIYNKIKSGNNISLSISSMRVDAFNTEIVKTLVAAGQKSATLAIEAGSERLRRVINKNLTEQQIFNAVKIAYENGLSNLKFYGMIGLPTETQEDLDELVDLAKRIKQQNKGFNISFGFSSFVPKPHTPFQWCGRCDNRILEKRLEYLKKELHKIGVSAQFSSLKWDYYQSVLSRGDSNLTDYLIDIYNNNCTIGAFKTCAKDKIDTDFYACENYSFDSVLPWDHIIMKPGKDFLIKENKRLLMP